MYVALDCDATDRAIALARTFGTRGRVLIPPEDLGPKGDLNDWLRVGAKGDATLFRSILERALTASPTPWVLQIQRLPVDLAPWDLEDLPGARDLLCELGHQGPLSRDVHLRLLAERCGVALATFRRRPANSLKVQTPSRKNIRLLVFRRTCRVYVVLDGGCDRPGDRAGAHFRNSRARPHPADQVGSRAVLGEPPF